MTHSVTFASLTNKQFQEPSTLLAWKRISVNFMQITKRLQRSFSFGWWRSGRACMCFHMAHGQELFFTPLNGVQQWPTSHHHQQWSFLVLVTGVTCADSFQPTWLWLDTSWWCHWLLRPNLKNWEDNQICKQAAKTPIPKTLPQIRSWLAACVLIAVSEAVVPLHAQWSMADSTSFAQTHMFWSHVQLSDVQWNGLHWILFRCGLILAFRPNGIRNRFGTTFDSTVVQMASLPTGTKQTSKWSQFSLALKLRMFYVTHKTPTGCPSNPQFPFEI